MRIKAKKKLPVEPDASLPMKLTSQRQYVVENVFMQNTFFPSLRSVCFACLVLSLNALSHGQTVDRATDLTAIEKQAKTVIDAVSPAIVKFAYGKERKLQFGCGVIVTPDGHVVISGPVHAVVDDDLLDLRLVDGRRVHGKAVGWSSEFKFGMLKFTDPGPWPHVELSDRARAGEVCLALGYPRSSPQKLRPDIRLGLITKSADGHWMTTSYRSEFSAHPVFNLDGKLLGLKFLTLVGGDPLHTSAVRVTAHWDGLVAGRNLDRLRLFSQPPERRQSTEDHPEGKEIAEKAIGRAKAATVRISEIDEESSLVSGVIVTSDGYVVTCGHHGRMPGKKLRLSLYDGRTATATILGANPVSDVGVLKIIDDGPWPHVEMGHSGTMRLGEPCVLIGYPRSKEGQEPWVFTTQVIKPTQTLPRRDDWYCQFWTSGFPESIQGASGGGVFDAQGRVIGVLLGGDAGKEMQHARIELFRKNWQTLTAGKPVAVVEAALVAETSTKLNRLALELSAPDGAISHQRTIELNDGEARCIAFSPDGKTVAGCGDRFVHLFDVTTGQRRMRYEGHGGRVRQVAFSHDGALIASASDDKTIRLWEPNSDRPARVLEGHTHPVSCLAFFPDGKTLVSASQSPSHLNEVRLWDVAAGRWDYRIREHHARGSLSAAVSADGSHCAVAGNGGHLTLYRVGFGLGTLSRLEHAEGTPVLSVSFSADGRRLISAGRDNTIRVWDVESGRQLLRLDGPAGGLGFQAAHFLPDQKTAISVTPGGMLQLWDLERRAVVTSRKCSDAQVRGLALSPDGSLAATCGGDSVIRLWSLPLRQVEPSNPGQRN